MHLGDRTRFQYFPKDPIRIKTLSHDFETELVEPAERRQVRAGEGSVRHVGVFQESGVGTFILGRP